MRAIGARPKIFPIDSWRPKQVLGGWGGNLPGEVLHKSKVVGSMVFEIADLGWV